MRNKKYYKINRNHFKYKNKNINNYKYKNISHYKIVNLKLKIYQYNIIIFL
jgi:hypothetical protein